MTKVNWIRTEQWMYRIILTFLSTPWIYGFAHQHFEWPALIETFMSIFHFQYGSTFHHTLYVTLIVWSSISVLSLFGPFEIILCRLVDLSADKKYELAREKLIVGSLIVTKEDLFDNIRGVDTIPAGSCLLIADADLYSVHSIWRGKMIEWEADVAVKMIQNEKLEFVNEYDTHYNTH